MVKIIRNVLQTHVWLQDIDGRYEVDILELPLSSVHMSVFMLALPDMYFITVFLPSHAKSDAESFVCCFFI